jgi:hypothetical protein
MRDYRCGGYEETSPAFDGASVLVSSIEAREGDQAAGSIRETWIMFVAMSNVPITFTF